MQQLPQIPGYRIMKKLGQGGMADVYLGVQENLARQVAIKVLVPSLFRDDQFSTRFVKEAQTAAHLTHPNIITIHDVNKFDDCYYIVMEYLEESLSQRMKKIGVMSPAQALSIIKMIASALDYAHRKGIIHRDIKPDNIMFRADQSVVLVDFGIARAMDSASHLTRTGMSIGTPHYMSPEQCRGEKIDGRSDFYSLGVQLFELLTGNVPYQAENTAGIIIKHIQEAIPRLPGHLSYWQPLIDKMMAKDKNNRISNGKELIFFIDALQHTRNGTEKMPPMPPTEAELATVKLRPVTASKPSFSFRNATRMEHAAKKPLLPIVLVSAIVVIIGIALYFLFRPAPAPIQHEEEIFIPVTPPKNDAQTENKFPTTTEKEPVTTTDNKNPDITPAVKEPPVKVQPGASTHPDVNPRKEPKVDEGESIEKQAELEQTIRQAREKKPRKAETVPAVNAITLLDLEPELRKSYNNQLQRIQIDIPKLVAMFQVKGIITYNLAIDEYGSVRVEPLLDNLEITPPRRERSVHAIISHKLNSLSLPPPKDKKGQSVRVINWRVTFKVGKYMNLITLTKQ